MTPQPPSDDAKSYVYLLQSRKSNRYYIGWTTNLLRRLREHNEDLSRATKRRGPYKLVFFETFISAQSAKLREKELKRNKKMNAAFKSRVSLCSPALEALKEVAG